MKCLSSSIHGALTQCSLLKIFPVVSSVSPTDGDKKKKPKGKEALESTAGLPAKLATLKVLSQKLHESDTVLPSSCMFRLQDDKKYCWQL